MRIFFTIHRYTIIGIVLILSVPLMSMQSFNIVSRMLPSIALKYRALCLRRPVGSCADHNSYGQTPLIQAIWLMPTDDPKAIVPLLDTKTINHPDNFGCSSLMFACAKGFEKISQLLLLAGADAKMQHPFCNPLLLAVESQKPALVKMLLWYITDPNPIASGSRSYDRYLKGDTAQLIIRFREPYHKKLSVQYTPLIEACGLDNSQIIDLLLNHGALSTTPGTYLPLHYACSLSHKKAVRALLEHNADPNTLDHDGDTALHNAVHGAVCGIVKQRDDEDAALSILEMLVLAGAQLDAKNKSRPHRCRLYTFLFR